MKNCPHCGASLHDEARFCMYCMTELGDRVPAGAPAPRSRRRSIALLAASAVIVAIAIPTAAILLRRDPPENELAAPAPAEQTEQTADAAPAADTADSAGQQTGSEPYAAAAPSASVSPSAAVSSAGTPSTTRPQSAQTPSSVVPAPSVSAPSSGTTPSVSAPSSDATPSGSTSSSDATPSGSTSSSDATPSVSTPSSDATPSVSTPSSGMTPSDPEPEPTPEPAPQHETVTYGYRAATAADCKIDGTTTIATFTVPEGAIVITGVETEAGDGVYVVPPSIDGKTVFAIDNYAFRNVWQSVNTVVLPRSLAAVASNWIPSSAKITDMYFYGSTVIAPAAISYIRGLTLHVADDGGSNAVCYKDSASYVYGAKYAAWNGVIDF